MKANSKVSARIRERRKELHLFAQNVADQAGMPYHRYTAIERDEVKITVEDLASIAPALDTTVIWLCRDLCDDRESECDPIPADA